MLPPTMQSIIIMWKGEKFLDLNDMTLHKNQEITFEFIASRDCTTFGCWIMHLFDFMSHRNQKATSAWMTILTQYCKIHRILHAFDYSCMQDDEEKISIHWQCQGKNQKYIYYNIFFLWKLYCNQNEMGLFTSWPYCFRHWCHCSSQSNACCHCCCAHSECVCCPLLVNQQAIHSFTHSNLFCLAFSAQQQCLHLFGKLTENFSYSLPVNWTFFSKMTLQPLTIAFMFCLSR